MILVARKRIALPKHQRGNMSMFPYGTMGQLEAGVAPVINESTEGLSQGGSGTIYCIYQLNSDGTSGTNSTATSPTIDTTTANSPWLSSGDPADVWVERTINTGTLDYDDIGASRVQLGSNRQIGVDINGGIQNANVDLDFYDAASGGTLLGTITVDVTASSF